MDIDGNSKVSLDEVLEFSRLIHPASVEYGAAVIMQVFDTNKDGKVSLEEAQKKSPIKANKFAIELFKVKFAAADKNKDGSLDKREIGLWEHAQADPDILKAVVASKMQFHDQDQDG